MKGVITITLTPRPDVPKSLFRFWLAREVKRVSTEVSDSNAIEDITADYEIIFEEEE